MKNSNYFSSTSIIQTKEGPRLRGVKVVGTLDLNERERSRWFKIAENAILGAGWSISEEGKVLSKKGKELGWIDAGEFINSRNPQFTRLLKELRKIYPKLTHSRVAWVE